MSSCFLLHSPPETGKLRGEKENLFMRSFTAFHWISEETGFRNLALC